METSNKTARELYEIVKADPNRRRFGFGRSLPWSMSTYRMDKHESPHFANLYDMALKYADVIPVAEVEAYMQQYKPAN